MGGTTKRNTWGGSGRTVWRPPAEIVTGGSATLLGHVAASSAAVAESGAIHEMHLGGLQPGGETSGRQLGRGDHEGILCNRLDLRIQERNLILLGSQGIALEAHRDWPACGKGSSALV
jgi:hypothetical protein